MSTTFTRTREQLRDMVLAKLGELDPGETVSANDATTVYEAIDVRLKELHRLGIFWRKVTSTPTIFSLSASIASASAGAGDILFPIRMTFTNGSEDDPIRIIGKDEYAAIPDKTTTGDPLLALWEAPTKFIFYPVPSANGTAKFIYERIIDDTAASTAPDVEVSMMRALKDMVAYDLADVFGKPEQMIQRLEREAMRAELTIRRLAVERIGYAPVQVDEFNDYRGTDQGTETDYGR